MANLNHCAACRQHYFLHEHACPHCGAAAPGGRLGRYVRRARVGGLMLFTALTTTACYGSPSYVGSLPARTKPSVEQPLPKVPTAIGTAYVFVTPKGKAKQQATIRLDKAVLEGTALTLHEAAPEAGASMPLIRVATLLIEAADAKAFQAPAKDEAFQALPIAQMKKLEVAGSYVDEKGRQATVEVKLPGATAAQGGLQLSRLDEGAIAGVLRVDYADTLIEVYFLAAR